ncbi:hypothetical protein SAMN05421827_1423 [Pedobacter terrae]|uniref:Uncharacterized protein n=1 Tax=Pedobacter terrae TaxID=405671 RepID=A0A1G8EMX2_9SPHI|nr:hypothetical protein SAMN05421827_1423 [Pedobacter terrae]
MWLMHGRTAINWWRTSFLTWGLFAPAGATQNTGETIPHHLMIISYLLINVSITGNVKQLLALFDAKILRLTQIF